MSPNNAADHETDKREAEWVEDFASSERWLSSLAADFEAENGETADAASTRFVTQALADYYSRF